MIGPDGKAITDDLQRGLPHDGAVPAARRALRGIVVAGLLSALMGSLAGVFNACSTLFTVDLYEKWKPGASQHQLVRTGRIATIVMVLIALAWIPVIKNAQGLYDYLQAVQGYLAPPIFVVFFFGVFFKRLNAAGRSLGHDRGLRAGHLPHAGGYPSHAGPAGFRTAIRQARSCGSSTTSTSSTSAC